MEFLSGLTQALQGNFAEGEGTVHPWVEDWVQVAHARWQQGAPWSEPRAIWNFQEALEDCSNSLFQLIPQAQSEVEAELLSRAQTAVLSLVDSLDDLLETEPAPQFELMRPLLQQNLSEVLSLQKALEQFSEASLDEQAGQGRSFRVSPEILELHRSLQQGQRGPCLARIEALRSRYREARRLMANEANTWENEIDHLLLALDELEGSLAEPAAKQRAWDQFLYLFEQLCLAMEPKES